MIPKNKWLVVGIILLGLLFLLGIPFLIRCFDNPGATVYDVSLIIGPSDWFAYYGALISAGAAVFGVAWSLRSNQKQYHKDQINQSLPFFIVKTYTAKSNYNPLSPLFKSHSGHDEQVDSMFAFQDEMQYSESLQDNICLTIKDGLAVAYKDDFSEQEWEIIKKKGIYEERKSDNCISVCRAKLIYVHFEFENVGRGAATYVRVGLSKTDQNHNFAFVEPRKVGEKFSLRLLIPNCCDSDVGDYDMDILYLDIYQRVYRQRMIVSIVNSDNGYSTSIDYRSTQEVLKSLDEAMKAK